jgi:hypothetical protein
MIYFAYGSNLDERQMALRCPGGKLTGVAQLAHYRLCFPRRSPIRNCAVASIEPYSGATVWGVTYELTGDDLKRLDAREGYDPSLPEERNRYKRISVKVTRLRAESLDAFAYVAVPEPEPGLPSPSYLKQIVGAAAAHGFPAEYINSLNAFPVGPES